MKHLFVFFTILFTSTLPSLAYDFEVDGIFYNLISLEDGTRAAEVTCDSIEFSYYSGEINIPPSVNYQGTSIPVVRIGEKAFQMPYPAVPLDSTEATSEPEDFGGPTSIHIPYSVNEIGEAAFYCCRELTTVELEDGLKNISYGAFWDCQKLTKINFPSTLESIGPRAFKRCSELKDIEIPSGLKEIGDGAFENCLSLTQIVLPESCDIALSAFDGCLGMKSVVIHKRICYSWFARNSSLERVTLGDEVECIMENAFKDCTNLSSISLSESVRQIGVNAFQNTALLNQQEDGIVYVGHFACSYKGEIPSDTKLEVREGTKAISDRAFYYCPASSIILPESIMFMGEGAFMGCNFTAFSVPSNVRYIPSLAFDSCKKLESIVLPESLDSIGDRAFERCQKLQSVTLPSSISKMGFSCFGGCKELTSVVSYIKEPMQDNSYFAYTSKDAVLHIPAGTREAYIAAGWDKYFASMEEFDTPATTYRPFIEEGKVWKVGSPDLLGEIYCLDTYYFEGDTIVGNKTCKKMMCHTEWKESYGHEPWTGYVGALYEESKRTYIAHPGSQQFVLLYDFAAPVGTTIDFYDGYEQMPSSCLISKKYMSTDSIFHGMVTEIKMYDPDLQLMTSTTYSEWREGVGYNCIQNVYNLNKNTDKETLKSCTVGDEVLYYNPKPIDTITPVGGEVKKQWLDFTHTTKPRPKAPMRSSQSATEEESLTGEYSAKELFVSLQSLSGVYTIRLTDAAGNEVYCKEVQTSNITLVLCIFHKAAFRFNL